MAGSDLQNLFSQAIQHHQTGNLAEAEALYNQILAELPDNANILGNLGLLYKDLGRLPEAEECLSKVLEKDPDNPNNHINLGAVFEEKGDVAKATASYRQALALSPDNPMALNNLGKVLHQQGNTAEALSCLEKATQLAPNYPMALNNLGVVYSAMNEHDKARRSFEQSVQLAPDDSGTLYNLAGVYNILGQKDKAAETYKRVLLLEPGHPSAKHMLAALEGKATDTAPAQYVEETFDKYAHNFDTHLQEKLEYKTPTLLKDMVDEELGGEVTFKRGIDLGCGTGLSGEVFQSRVQHFTGIDLSGKMLAKAEEKGVYETVAKEDITSFLKNGKNQYDLFVAADVFVYLGKMEAVFQAVRENAAPSASFVFSVERMKESEGAGDFVLRNSGRYAHNPAYIEQLALAHGFTILARKESNIRKEQQEWIEGVLFLLQASPEH